MNNKTQYLGKWLSKSGDGDETPIDMIDVIEVVNEEVKAIGRNMPLSELLRNYVRFEDSGFGVEDPFALPPGVLAPDDINEDLETYDEKQISEKQIQLIPKTLVTNHLSGENVDAVYEPAKTSNSINTFQKVVKTENVNMSTNQTVQNDVKSYTTEEVVVIKSIGKLKESEETGTEIVLSLNFSLDKLLNVTDSLGISTEETSNIIGDNFEEIVNFEEVQSMIKESILNKLESIKNNQIDRAENT